MTGGAGRAPSRCAGLEVPTNRYKYRHRAMGCLGGGGTELSRLHDSLLPAAGELQRDKTPGRSRAGDDTAVISANRVKNHIVEFVEEMGGKHGRAEPTSSFLRVGRATAGGVCGDVEF